jgi:hypothetical protein
MRKLKRGMAVSRCEPTPLHPTATGSSPPGPGEPRFTNIKILVKVFSHVEYADRCTFETRFYNSSAPLDIDRLADAERGHWGVESMDWLLDEPFVISAKVACSHESTACVTPLARDQSLAEGGLNQNAVSCTNL